MKYCSKCGNEVFDEAVVCPKCGCMISSPTTSNSINSGDKADVGLCIISALVPFVGLILWLVKRKEEPKKANACGIAALAAAAFYFLMWV